MQTDENKDCVELGLCFTRIVAKKDKLIKSKKDMKLLVSSYAKSLRKNGISNMEIANILMMNDFIEDIKVDQVDVLIDKIIGYVDNIECVDFYNKYDNENLLCRVCANCPIDSNMFKKDEYELLKMAMYKDKQKLEFVISLTEKGPIFNAYETDDYYEKNRLQGCYPAFIFPFTKLYFENVLCNGQTTEEFISQIDNYYGKKELIQSKVKELIDKLELEVSLLTRVPLTKASAKKKVTEINSVFGRSTYFPPIGFSGIKTRVKDKKEIEITFSSINGDEMAANKKGKTNAVDENKNDEEKENEKQSGQDINTTVENASDDVKVQPESNQSTSKATSESKDNCSSTTAPAGAKDDSHKLDNDNEHHLDLENNINNTESVKDNAEIKNEINGCVKDNENSQEKGSEDNINEEEYVTQGDIFNITYNIDADMEKQCIYVGSDEKINELDCQIYEDGFISCETVRTMSGDKCILFYTKGNGNYYLLPIKNNNGMKKISKYMQRRKFKKYTGSPWLLSYYFLNECDIITRCIYSLYTLKTVLKMKCKSCADVIALTLNKRVIQKPWLLECIKEYKNVAIKLSEEIHSKDLDFVFNTMQNLDILLGNGYDKDIYAGGRKLIAFNQHGNMKIIKEPVTYKGHGIIFNVKVEMENKEKNKRFPFGFLVQCVCEYVEKGSQKTCPIRILSVDEEIIKVFVETSEEYQYAFEMLLYYIKTMCIDYRISANVSISKSKN